jgi:hypothetical protein
MPAVSKKLQPITSFFRFLSLVAFTAHSFCGVCLRGCSTDCASGVFDRPSINGKVYLIMPRSINYHEVFYRIIECISVYMMNILLACKFFSRMLFDNPSMFICPIVSFVTNLYSYVSFPSASYNSLGSYRKIFRMGFSTMPLGRVFRFFNRTLIGTIGSIKSAITFKSSIMKKFFKDSSTSTFAYFRNSFFRHIKPPYLNVIVFQHRQKVNINYGGI